MDILRGRVIVFDERRGLGVVESSSGARYDFHCTAIDDGTRTIADHARVEFTLVPGPVGRFEAGAIRAIG